MTNEELENFIDTGWFNEATLYYKGYIYWFEANWEDDKKNHFHFFVYRFKAKNIDNKYFDRLNDDSLFKYEFEFYGYGEDDVRPEVLKAKIFEGKSFWEVEPELIWLDE